MVFDDNPVTVRTPGYRLLGFVLSIGIAMWIGHFIF
jgi:hypothetical protein